MIFITIYMYYENISIPAELRFFRQFLAYFGHWVYVGLSGNPSDCQMSSLAFYRISDYWCMTTSLVGHI